MDGSKQLVKMHRSQGTGPMQGEALGTFLYKKGPVLHSDGLFTGSRKVHETKAGLVIEVLSMSLQ